jgi:hypothetical protein
MNTVARPRRIPTGFPLCFIEAMPDALIHCGSAEVDEQIKKLSTAAEATTNLTREMLAAKVASTRARKSAPGTNTLDSVNEGGKRTRSAGNGKRKCR